MKALLDKGADPNWRLNKKVWYSGYSFDLSGVDEIGATAFWRAAYASDVDAMKLLVAYGADPNIRTKKSAGRPRAGDIDRIIIEWRSLLRQIAHAPEIVWPRWRALQSMAKEVLNETESPTLTDLPPLQFHQTKRLDHRLQLRRH